VAASTSGNAAELAFTYRGPTREVAHLGSGEVRQQIGLKLRAQNTCNVVYVMWYVAPGTGIHASVKANPGLRTHADCGDRGYIDLKTTTTSRRTQSSSRSPENLVTALARVLDSALAWPPWSGTRGKAA
jgi:hypothetical protein